MVCVPRRRLQYAWDESRHKDIRHDGDLPHVEPQIHNMNTQNRGINRQFVLFSLSVFSLATTQFAYSYSYISSCRIAATVECAERTIARTQSISFVGLLTTHWSRVSNAGFVIRKLLIFALWIFACLTQCYFIMYRSRYEMFLLCFICLPWWQ